jgi:hypothetical protein
VSYDCLSSQLLLCQLLMSVPHQLLQLLLLLLEAAAVLPRQLLMWCIQGDVC